MAVKHGLGRGLNALIKETPITTPSPQPESAGESVPGILNVPVDRIRENPFQPRKQMVPEALEDMVQSIRTHGILGPLLLRRVGSQYELIAGERRLRAARQAGLKVVPAVVKEMVNDQDALELALIENLQREDLNAIEEAEGYSSWPKSSL